MKVIFVGNCLPEDIFFKVSNVTPSTNNVQLNYIDYLADEYGADNVIVATLHFGTRKLQNVSEKKVQEMTFRLSNGIAVHTSSFIKSRVLLNISAVISMTRLISRIKQGFNKEEKILYVIDNHYYFHSLPVLFNKKRNDCVITIMNEGFDVRYDHEHRPTVKDWIVNAINGYAFKRNDGIISFCKATTDRYAPNVKAINLMYSCEYSGEYSINVSVEDTKTILYAGLLNPCYGLTNIIEAMSLLPENYKLVICGGGKQEIKDYVVEAAERDNRIQFLGLISRDRVLELEYTSDVLLLIRTSDTKSSEYIAKYYQPSKLPEYLLSKTPILATNIEGIPGEMKNYLNFTDASVESIASAIRDICERDTQKATQKAEAGFRFAIENCNNDKQKSEIIRFIRDILADKWG